MNWKEYQQKTAEVFRKAGCTADVEFVVAGARAEHEIDVYVTFQQYGVTCSWVVECKCWNSNVPKEKVLALQAVVDDVGADRGVLISKTGFQSGAIRATHKSNITLTSLDDLIEELKENSTRRAIETLEISLTKTKHSILSLYKTEKLGENHGRIYYLDGVDGKTAVIFVGKLCLLEHGFENIKLGKKSYPYKFSDCGNKIQTTRSIEQFLELVQNEIEICKRAFRILCQVNHSDVQNFI